MNIAKIRKFLMDWVMPPRGIRVVCYVMSRCLRGLSTIHSFERKSERLYVLANGPSLKKDLACYRGPMELADRLAVNFALVSPEVVDLRPTIYLLSDPAFFMPVSDVAPALRDKMVRLRDMLLTRVTWPMTLIVPDTALNSDLIKALSVRPNISVVTYWRGIPVPEDIVDFDGWMRNRYAPPSQNVINTALYLGVVWRYREVILLGADTSFHAMLRLDQQTNRPYIENEHFYGSERQYLYRDEAHTIPQKLSEQFTCIATAFRWYDKLREFADWAGVKIVNASSFSWIDAFERPKTTGGSL